jgi:small subunit ribosomal protein S9
MAEEPEQQDEQQPDQPEDPRVGESSGDDQPAAAEESAEDAPAAEEPAEDAPAAEEPAGKPAEDAPAADEPAEDAPIAEEATAEQPKAEVGKDLPPGAELDPIAVEPERPLSAEERARLEAEAEERARREAEATAEAPEEQPASTPRSPADLARDARYIATGKRKRSIARVIVTPGDGKFEVNRRSLQEYFPRSLHQTTATQPLAVSGYEGTVDVRVNVRGGGIGGQAGAVRHGVARALTEIDPQLRRELKRRGFLTRDARVKERRKAGLKKARKRPQFSKR